MASSDLEPQLEPQLDVLAECSSSPMASCPRPGTSSPDFLALELERVWYRVWQVACREEEIPNPGDFVEYTIGDQSILVVRVDARTVQAHCQRVPAPRHATRDGPRVIRRRVRSSAATTAGATRLDGRLTEVVDRDEFPTLPDDLRSGRCACERWGGFVFVNLDPNAEPLLDFLAPAARDARPRTSSTRCGCGRRRPRTSPRTGRS